MTTFVDGVAMALPWAGGLVPATLTYQNLCAAGYEWWQAGVVAAIVEGMGFVSVTTMIDIYEHNRAALPTAQDSWSKPPSLFDGAFYVAFGGSVIYWLAVLIINTILDASASPAKLIIGGLLSTFGVLGGVMVALRNQLGKRREALALAESRKRQAEDERKLQAQRERDLQLQAQSDRERDALEHQRKIQEEELRMKHELNLRKLEEKSKKDTGKFQKVSPDLPGFAETSQKVPEGAESSQKVSESENNLRKFPATFGKWHDWRKLPESEKKVIATFETPEQVAERYGGSLKTCGNWLMNAKKEYAHE